MMTWFLNHSRLLRRSTQIFSLVFLIAVPFLNKQGHDWFVGTLYSIDILGWTIADPAMILQMILLGQPLLWTLVLAVLIPIILALIFGRIFCSWMCPYNFLAELLYKLRRLVFPREKNRNHNPVRNSQWAILASIFLLILLTGIPLIVFLSMPGLLTAEITDLVFGGDLGLELVLVACVLLLDTFILKRAWCKFLCPVGFTLSLFKTPLTLRVISRSTVCVDCDTKREHTCNQACPLDLNPRISKNLYPGCYNCLDCVCSCHQHGGALDVEIGSSQKIKNTYKEIA